jgi:hypothetical protein
MKQAGKTALILVTGADRSGVAMIAAVMSRCGAWCGQFQNLDEYDGRGSFENIAVKNALMTPLFKGLRADPTGQHPLPRIEACQRIVPSISGAWRRRFEGIAFSQGYAGGPAFYASYRSALVWPIWNGAFPDAKWVIVRRRDEDIVASCMKTGFMTAFKDDKGWQKWLDSYKARFGEMVKAKLDVHQIWSDRMLHGHLSELHALVGEIKGLEWDETAVRDFIAPVLWKNGVFAVKE